MFRSAAVLAVVLLASGCVSSGTHEEVLGERDQLASRNQELRAELERLRADRAETAARLAREKAEAERRAATQASLVNELQSELASGKVRIEQLRDGIRVELAEDILFPTGSAELDAGGVEVLRRVSARLAEVPDRIEVQGHTDNVPVGPRLKSRYPTNWELAGARAARVVRLLADEGVQVERLSAVSYGPFHPVAPNDTAEGRARNRRIELRLLPR